MRTKTLLGLSLAAALVAALACRRRRPRRWPAFPPAGTPGTALVTGASSGIGAAYARALAARGYDLVLVARRQERLETLAAELGQRYGIAAGFLAADLADPEQVGNVEQWIAGLDNLEVLVHAAGFGTMGGFTTIPVERHLEMLHVHDTAAVRLAHAALGGMVVQKRGAIVLVSSAAAFAPIVGNVTYCASKAYLVAFAEGLQTEAARDGVQMQALCPGFTDTEFHETPEYTQHGVKERIPRLLWSSPEAVVAASLEALERGEVVCVPGWINRAFVAVARLGVVNAIARMLLHRFRRPAHTSSCSATSAHSW
jgi:short-subunit dehydrogenase